MKVKGYWMKETGDMSVLYDGVSCHPATQAELVFWQEIAALREQVKYLEGEIKEIYNRWNTECAALRKQIRRRDEALKIADEYLSKHSHGPKGISCWGCTALAAIREAREGT